jgi:hypothetical protein
MTLPKRFSGAFTFAINSALSNQIDLQDKALLLVKIPVAGDLGSGTLIRPEISHSTVSSDFAAMVTSTGGTHQITPSTGLSRWNPLDYQGYHIAGRYARLHSVLSSGADKTSTGAYTFPCLGVA